MVGKYTYSLNGERYRGAFDSREEALAEAIEAARQSVDGPQSVYVGRIVPPDSKASGHARTVLSNMMARAREEYGDSASKYLVDLPKQLIEDLDEALELTIRGWLHLNGLIPTFFKVEAISEYPVPTVSSQTTLQGEAREVQEIGSGEYET